MLAMAEGAPALGETIAILRQARRDSQDLLRAASTYALALALDRSGDADEAAAVLREAGVDDAASVSQNPRVKDAMGVTADRESHAMLALALEVAGRREAAKVEWQAYLANGGAGGPWEAHARSHAGPARPR
jgi:hypothetical protein